MSAVSLRTVPTKRCSCASSRTDEAKKKGKTKVETQPQDNLPFPLPTLFLSQEQTRPSKAEALKRADGLAKGFVLLEISVAGAEDGWTWVLEGKDEPTICALKLFIQTVPVAKWGSSLRSRVLTQIRPRIPRITHGRLHR